MGLWVLKLVLFGFLFLIGTGFLRIDPNDDSTGESIW